MNKELFLKVADAIEKGYDALVFDMTTYATRHNCGTSACIAGYAVAVHHGWNGDQLRAFRDHLTEDKFSNVANEAQKLLELDDDTALELFTATWLDDEAAVKLIRKSVESGHIDVFDKEG